MPRRVAERLERDQLAGVVEGQHVGALGRLAPELAGGFARAGRKGILREMSQEDYLLANQPSELERLRLQSLVVWERNGRQPLSKVGGGSGARALDVGCGAMGWLRILREWVGPSGQIVGADIDESMPTPLVHSWRKRKSPT